MQNFKLIEAYDVRNGKRPEFVPILQIDDGNHIVVLVSEFTLTGSGFRFAFAFGKPLQAFSIRPDRAKTAASGFYYPKYERLCPGSSRPDDRKNLLDRYGRLHFDQSWQIPEEAG